MPIDHPYYRIARPHSSNQRDILNCFTDRQNAPDANDLIRAGKLLETELLHIFEYVEPNDDNIKTYSHQLYQLLLRASTEVEANCTAILAKNDYRPPKKREWNMEDYRRIEAATRLSEYHVAIPFWRGVQGRRRPFAAWSGSDRLSWYQDYNTVKHDRSAQFKVANLVNVLDAVTGVFVLLFAQFSHHAFDPYHPIGFIRSGDDGAFSHDASIFQVKEPRWPEDEWYQFYWSEIKKEPNPFRQFAFR